MPDQLTTTPNPRRLALADRLDRYRPALRTLLYGSGGADPNGDGEDVSPFRPAPRPVQDRALGPVRRHVVLAASALSGLAGATLIVATAPVWRLAAPSWRLTLPGVPHPGSSFFNGATFLAGVVLMTLGWIGLIGRAERQQGSERRRLAIVVVVTALWTVPVVLGPPLLSHDVYSYVAQGELASRGLDPTAHGPIYLGRGPIMTAADPVWRTNPAPYGPVAIAVSEAVVEVTGHDAAAAVWGWRAVVVVAMALTAAGVALIARSAGVSPAVAIAVGIANPLVLLHLVGGIHNDALMLALLSLGLAAWMRDRRVLAVVLIAGAVAIKLPAAVALGFIGWNWFRAEVPVRRRVAAVAAVTVAGAGIVAVLCVVVGIGPGWVTALSNTGKIMSTFSGTTKLGYVLSDAARAVGIGLPEQAVVAGTRLAGMALTGVGAVLVLFRSPRLGVVRAVGLVLVLYVILGPVVWPWYLPAGFALLAAVGLGRYRPSYLVLVFAVSLLVWPTSVNAVPSLSRYQHLLGLGVVLLIAAAAWGAQWFAQWQHQRRLERAQRLDRPGPLGPGGRRDGAPPIPAGAVVTPGR